MLRPYKKRISLWEKLSRLLIIKAVLGKTTTTYHIGCALALFHEKKVLLIDVDPQTNLTFLCAIPERWKKFKEDNGTVAKLFHAYLNNRLDSFDLGKIIWRFPIRIGTNEVISELELIPSDVELLGVDIDLAAKTTRKK